ncbi:MAG: hypothetical protein K5762_06720 [Bacilli bacterium]|nr:hypothetical protein [Bacilli bacterium]
MMKKGIFLLLATCLLASCGSNTSSISSAEKENSITVDHYVSDVASTAPFMISGVDGEETVDYVISSYPVIFSAMSNKEKKTNLSIYKNVASEFSTKYSTEGFPQAGLFIKSELYNKYVAAEEKTLSNVDSFLTAFDAATADLKAGGTNAISAMTAYSEDLTQQATRFGFNANVIKNVQKENNLAFITHDKNPTAEQLGVFSAPLGINIAAGDLASSLYDPTKAFESTTALESLPYSVLCPKGAPAATFASFAADENLNLTSPDNVRGGFATKTSDFIVFDAVNGVKLSKANADSYKLVRMVTFGNLYIVATGNDEDGVLTDEDYIVSYGEGLVPDLAFKAVFNA